MSSLFVSRPRLGEKFAQHRQRFLEQLSARRTQHGSSVKHFYTHTHTHVHARFVTHTCINNLVGEASVSVREQSFLACCKQTFYTPSPVSALLFSLAKGSSSPNRILSNGHPTVINKDTGSSARWTWCQCAIYTWKSRRAATNNYFQFRLIC